jgi:geranylgeranyl diphosphate synthase type I
MVAAQTINSYFATHVPRIEEEMRRILNRTPLDEAASFAGPLPALFNTMLNYHVGFADADGTPTQVYSGKRIRPVLTLLSCEASGGPSDAALPAAAAIELLHNFSLIHDDIEDRDEIRRGRATLWKLWGDAQAINIGDAMFALAHTALERLEERGIEPKRVLRTLRAFDEAAVALTAGQHLDLSFVMRPDVQVNEYMTMIQGKTGALIQAACAIGGLIGGAMDDCVQALASFGAWLGVAFQLQDDVLGIWGDPEVTGKQDSDLSHRKRTLPVLYAAEQNERVRELYLMRDWNSDADLRVVRELIEASGAREYTQQAALDAYTRSLQALDAAQVDNPYGTLLRLLAQSLMGREA